MISINPNPNEPLLLSYREIDFCGDGTLITMKRANILQTWFYKAEYNLNDNILILSQTNYETYCSVFLINSVILYNEQSVDTASFKADEGQIAYFTSTDNKEWVELTLKTGESGWFKITNFNRVLQDGKECHGEELFYFLSNAG